MEISALIETMVSAGEHDAFHSSPLAGIGSLRSALAMASAAEEHQLADRASWLLGVCLASSGSFGEALAVLAPLPEDTSREIASPTAAMAAATIASIYRQIGMHSAAQQYDRFAIAEGRSAGSDAAQFDGQLGLAADAVGLLDTPAAQLHWQAARERSGGQWRERVRLNWVAAEIALMQDRNLDAATAALQAIEDSTAADAPRHQAKSLLFAGVALLPAERARGIAYVESALELATRLGARPLIWPAHLVLAAAQSDGPSSERHRALASATIIELAGELPQSWQIGGLLLQK